MSKKKEKILSEFKFNKDDLRILKHFASINNSQVLYPDNFIVYSPSLSIYGEYTIVNEKGKGHNFEPFGVYYVNELLQIISIYESKNEDYIIKQYDNYLKFESKTSSTVYPIVELEMLERFSKKLNDTALSKMKELSHLMLSEDKINMIKKIGNIIKANKISFIKDGKNIQMMIKNTEIGDSSVSHVDVIESNDIIKNDLKKGIEYSISFENFIMLSYNYDVKIYDKLILFINEVNNLRYVITLEDFDDENDEMED